MLNIENLELFSGKQNIIGEGTFGIVTKGLYCGTPVAVKELKGKEIKQIGYLKEEIETLRDFTHPNIVSMLANSDKFIVMELFDGNAEYKNGITLEELSIIGRDCMRAISYMKLHNYCLIHADIKPENILVKRNNNGSIYKAVLGDVGLSMACGTRFSGFTGTPGYMPQKENHVITNLDDVYALAVSLLDSYFQEDIHAKYTDEESDYEDNTYEYASKLPQELRYIIGRMLAAIDGVNIGKNYGSCQEEKNPKYKDLSIRKEPPYNAENCKDLVRRGNDGRYFVSKLSERRGIYAWSIYKTDGTVFSDELLNKFIIMTTKDFSSLVESFDKSSKRKR